MTTLNDAPHSLVYEDIKDGLPKPPSALEKAARAVQENGPRGCSRALSIHEAGAIARAVLMAVRDPERTAARDGMQGVMLRSPTATWQIMIDAILNETTTPCENETKTHTTR